MNSHTVKARSDHYINRRSPVPSIRKAQVHPANHEKTDSCLRSLALAKSQQGDCIKAITLLSQLINRHPHNATDYNNRGLVYFQSGQLRQSLGDYNTALQLNPQLFSAYNNRANYYAACGHLEAALRDYEQAIDLNPSYVRAWINRGITLRDLKLYDQAVENFDIAEGLSRIQTESNSEVLGLVGHIYGERGRTYHLWGDWNCAVTDYRRALTQLPQKIVSTNPSSRLRRQVETWLSNLLSPLVD